MRRILFLSTLLVFAATFLVNTPVAHAQQPDHKQAICHIPPGNPHNAHTIVVDSHAIQAHLDHGDYLGECEVAPVIGGGTVG